MYLCYNQWRPNQVFLQIYHAKVASSAPALFWEDNGEGLFTLLDCWSVSQSRTTLEQQTRIPNHENKPISQWSLSSPLSELLLLLRPWLRSSQANAAPPKEAQAARPRRHNERRPCHHLPRLCPLASRSNRLSCAIDPGVSCVIHRFSIPKRYQLLLEMLSLKDLKFLY